MLRLYVSLFIVGFGALPLLGCDDGSDNRNGNQNGHSNDRVVVYFTRHAEKKTSVDDDGINICGSLICAQELNDKGLMRAELLVDWFKQQGITPKLTHAFSSHKLRTWQTIEMITADAGLSDGATDFDKREGDGIQEFPIFASGISDDFATELDPQSTAASKDLTISALLALPRGSVALVAGHSGTLYDIMAGIGLMDACGGDNNIETCNRNRYPIDENNRVANFGDIWEVVLVNGVAKFSYRSNLQPTSLHVVERVD
jgi:broad specificity phosphatase PhoE